MIRSKVFQAWLGFFAVLITLFGCAIIFSYSIRPALGLWLLMVCWWCPLVIFVYAVCTSVRESSDDVVS